MEKVWKKMGDVFVMEENSHKVKALPPGIYLVEFNPQIGFYLREQSRRFSFEFKLYGLEEKLVRRIQKTFHHTTGNLGVLLNGTRGTGKSVTSKVLCNELDLPVLVITADLDGLNHYLSSFQQDVVVFIDEYEKIYDKADSSLLGLMDGVLSTEHRKLFLLTTNDLYINPNLMQRPSRVRYIKTFGDLPKEIVEEILDDMLEIKELREACLEFIASMGIITIDLVKAVVQEVNIHQEAPGGFKDIFNIRALDNRKWDVFEIKGEGEDQHEVLLYGNTSLNIQRFNNMSEGQMLHNGHSRLGIIMEVLDEDSCRLKVAEQQDDPRDSKKPKDKRRKVSVEVEKVVRIREYYGVHYGYRNKKYRRELPQDTEMMDIDF